MKDLKIIFTYALHYWKYALANFFFNFLSVIFALFSFTLIIPFLQLLFEKTKPVSQMLPWELSGEVLQHNFYYFLGEIIAEKGKLRALVFVCIGIILATLLKSIFAYFASYYMAPVMNGTVRDFQKKLYNKILELPLSFFSEEKKGDIMARTSGDIEVIKATVTDVLNTLCRDPLTIIVFLIYMVYISPGLTLFVFGFIPLVGFIIGLIGKSLKRTSIKGQIKAGEILSIVEETLGGLRIIKAFNAEKTVSQRYQGYIDEFYKLMNRVTRKYSLSQPVSETLGITVIAIIIIYGGSMVLDHTSSLTGELFITYIAIFSQILTPAKSLSRAYYNIKKGSASIQRVEEVLKAENKITEKENAVSVSDLNTFIEYKNVSFKYESEYVLKNINLKIEKGKTIALVGHSGSGKSTLVDLLPRFYDVIEGEILIDGVNIKDMKINDLRQLMGNVNQEAVLFNDTIYNNIAFSKENTNLEEIEAAATTANAKEFIDKLPKKYDTNIGDRGNKLSGGQKQRLSIARAIIQNPPILILDEATSALDSESEKLVQKALGNIMKNRTSIVIAHRLSTIRTADEICVLSNGEIVERGKHEELLALNGTYTKLHNLQMY